MSSFRSALANGYPLRTFLILLTTVAVVFLVIVPLVVLLRESVSTQDIGAERVYTLSGFMEMLGQPRTYRILGNSVVYAAGSSLIAFLIGGVLIWLVQRTNIPAKGMITVLTLFPLFMPPVLATIGWVLLLDPNIGLMNVMAQTI